MAAEDSEGVALGSVDRAKHQDLEGDTGTLSNGDVQSISTAREEDILALQDLDPALNKKMRLVNNVGDTAILKIAFTMGEDMMSVRYTITFRVALTFLHLGHQ